MTVFQVNQSAKFVSGTFTRPYLVRNGGAELVYLGQDSSLTPGTQSISMPAGSTLNWSGDTELWACTDPGKISNLEVLYTADSAFTPGPTNVNATLTPLLDNLFYISVTPTDFSYQSPWVDVLDYQTLIVETTGLLAGGSPYDGNSDIRVDVEWSINASIITAYTDEVFGAPGAGTCNYRFPVIARYVRFTITRKNPAIALQTINFKVNGLNDVLPARYFSLPEPSAYSLAQFSTYILPTNADDYQRAGAYSSNGTMAAVRNGFVPIPHIAGPSNMGWGRIVQTNTGSVAMGIGIMDGADISYLFRTVLFAAGLLESVGVTFFTPKWPICLKLQTAGLATASFIAAVGYQGNSTV